MVDDALLALDLCAKLTNRRKIHFPNQMALSDADLAEDTETLLGKGARLSQSFSLIFIFFILVYNY